MLLEISPLSTNKFYYLFAIFSSLILVSCGAMSSSEPTDEELDQAVRQHFQSIAGVGVISNPINNVHLKLEEVRKLGCEPASEGPGFFCSYSTRITTGVSSNETSSEGVAHAEAAGMLLGMMTGGDYGIVDNATHRFVKTFGGWELVSE